MKSVDATQVSLEDQLEQLTREVAYRRSALGKLGVGLQPTNDRIVTFARSIAALGRQARWRLSEGNYLQIQNSEEPAQ